MAFLAVTGATAAVFVAGFLYFKYSDGLPDIPQVDQYRPPILTEVVTQDAVLTSFDRILAMLTAALAGIAAVSLSVAGIGIMNVMLVSVSERTREIGLLRALGMTRAQLRQTVRLESVAISVYGAVLGVVVGLGLGVALQRSLADEGIGTLGLLGIPWTLLATVLVLAAVVGVVAALWPARRAARRDVLQAIMTE